MKNKNLPILIGVLIIGLIAGALWGSRYGFTLRGPLANSGMQSYASYDKAAATGSMDNTAYEESTQAQDLRAAINSLNLTDKASQQKFIDAYNSWVDEFNRSLALQQTKATQQGTKTSATTPLQRIGGSMGSISCSFVQSLINLLRNRLEQVSQALIIAQNNLDNFYANNGQIGWQAPGVPWTPQQWSTWHRLVWEQQDLSIHRNELRNIINDLQRDYDRVCESGNGN